MSSLRAAAVAAAIALATCSLAAPANPLSLIGETYSTWKERLFGSHRATPATIDAPAEGAIELPADQPLRFRVDAKALEREFPKGKSRYRTIELPQELEHAALRIQVIARRNEKGRGNAVFKPLLYVFGDGDEVRDTVEAKPLHLDIRPFRRTRLLGCVALENVRRFAVATPADAVGKSYDSEVREAVKAPTQYGFYYATDAVKVKLPYADTGELILEITRESAKGKGC